MEDLSTLDPLHWEDFLYSPLNPERNTAIALQLWNSDRSAIEARGVEWYERHYDNREEATKAWRRQRLRVALPDISPSEHENRRRQRSTDRASKKTARPHRRTIDPLLWPIGVTAEYLRMSARRVRDLVEEGSLPCVWHRGRRYFTKERLDEYLKSL